MENDIPSVFVKIGGKNYKASLYYDEVIALTDIIMRLNDLRYQLTHQKSLTLAENIELMELFLTFIHVALVKEYPQLTRAQLAEILTTTNVDIISGKIQKMFMSAYSDRPEERNLKGCRLHLTLLKKE